MPTTRLTREELERLYEKHGAALAAYGCACGLDHGLAQDAVQRVFLKLAEREVTIEHSAVGYLYRAVRNAVANQRRDRRNEVALAGRDLWFERNGAGLDEVLSLEAALRELPEEQREAVFLKVWSGLTLQEIAETTATSLNTVASRYRYALEKLREKLGG